MGVQITRQRRYLETVQITMDFRFSEMPSAGCAFSLTLDGEPVEWTVYEADVDVPNARPRLVPGHGRALGELASANLARALDGEDGLYLHEVWVQTGQNDEPAEGRCPCGGVVTLDAFYDNPCSKCDRTFAQQGWEMAPPWQRGEEISYGMEDEALEIERFESAYLEGV